MCAPNVDSHAIRWGDAGHQINEKVKDLVLPYRRVHVRTLQSLTTIVVRVFPGTQQKLLDHELASFCHDQWSSAAIMNFVVGFAPSPSSGSPASIRRAFFSSCMIFLILDQAPGQCRIIAATYPLFLFLFSLYLHLVSMVSPKETLSSLTLSWP